MANIKRRGEGGGGPDLRREIDRLFEDFFSPGVPARYAAAEFVPRLEMREEGERYLVRVELPGTKPDGVEINVDNDVLTVRGERKQEESREERGYAYSEYSYGSFSRSIQLPPGTSAEKVTADFRDGILEIAIPKGEAARPRRVAIGTGGQETQPAQPSLQAGKPAGAGAQEERAGKAKQGQPAQPQQRPQH